MSLNILKENTEVAIVGKAKVKGREVQMDGCHLTGSSYNKSRMQAGFPDYETW